jgi:hypothetical protein
MKPSERIAQLINEMADLAMDSKKTEGPEAFLQKVMGLSDSDLRDTYMKRDDVKIAAIVLYLDEKAETIQ